MVGIGRSSDLSVLSVIKNQIGIYSFIDLFDI